MIIVAVEAEVEESAISGVRDAIDRMEEQSRKEAGCLTYAFSTDINNPNTIRVFERWESMEALQAHFKTPHMAEFNKALAELQPKSLDIKAYEVTREVPLPR